MLGFTSVINSKGMYLYGTIHRTSHIPKGIVLLVHGHLSSNRIGPNRLYYEISNNLCSLGFDVYRFDLSGMGESDGNIESTSFEDHVNDVLTVIDNITQSMASIPLYLVAHCVGCNISLDAMIKSQKIDKAIFISPFFSNKSSLSRMFSDKQLNEMQSSGSSWRKGLYTGRSFFLDACAEEVFFEKIQIEKERVHVVYGSEEQYIAKEDCLRLYADIGQEKLFIENGDHNFLIHESRKRLMDFINSKLAEVAG